MYWQGLFYLEFEELRGWCITLRITGFLGFVHRPEGPNRIGISFPYLRMETASFQNIVFSSI
jgi:hypothetical protein